MYRISEISDSTCLSVSLRLYLKEVLLHCSSGLHDVLEHVTGEAVIIHGCTVKLLIESKVVTCHVFYVLLLVLIDWDCLVLPPGAYQSQVEDIENEKIAQNLKWANARQKSLKNPKQEKNKPIVDQGCVVVLLLRLSSNCSFTTFFRQSDSIDSLALP